MTITLHRRGPGGYRVLVDHDLVGWVRQEADYAWSAHRYVRPGSVLTVELGGTYRSRQAAVAALVDGHRIRGPGDADRAATTSSTPPLGARHAMDADHRSSGPDRRGEVARRGRVGQAPRGAPGSGRARQGEDRCAHGADTRGTGP
jgi:hypothetical protein